MSSCYFIMQPILRRNRGILCPFSLNDFIISQNNPYFNEINVNDWIPQQKTKMPVETNKHPFLVRVHSKNIALLGVSSAE